MEKEYIYISLFVLLIFLLFGFSINKLIDKKLSDININIPRINIPEPKIIVKMKKHRRLKNTEKDLTNGALNPPVEGFEPSNKEKGEFKESPRDENNSRDTSGKIPYIWEKEVEEDKFHEDKNSVPSYLGRVIGCQKEGKKVLQPDQIACNQPNYKTAEHYYDYYFKYPVIPQMDQDRWLPSNMLAYDNNTPPDRNFRVVPQNYSNASNKAPLPSNYYFGYVKL